MDSPERVAGVWFGLLAAPSAWIVQGLAGWWIGAAICTKWPVGTVRASLGVVGVLALIVALVGLISSLRRWHAGAGREPAIDQPDEFLLFGGVFVSSAFTVGILWATFNAFFITVCGVMR